MSAACVALTVVNDDADWFHFTLWWLVGWFGLSGTFSTGLAISCLLYAIV